MKISKYRIKQLISESLAKALKEDTGDTGDTGYEEDTGLIDISHLTQDATLTPYEKEMGMNKKSLKAPPISKLMYAPNQSTLIPVKLGIGGISTECVFASDLSDISASDELSLRNFYKKNNWNPKFMSDYLFGQADFWPSLTLAERQKMGGGLSAPHKKINVADGDREYKASALPVAWTATAVIFLEDYDKMINDLAKYARERGASSPEEYKKIVRPYVFRKYGIEFDDLAKIKNDTDFLKKSMNAIGVDNLDYDPNEDN